jgi:formate dehydrogenase beta subunit
MGVLSCWGERVEREQGILPLPEEFRPGLKIKAFMGWDGFEIRDESVNIVDMCLAWMEEIQRYSCGKCFPCRIGTKVACEILRKILRGQGEEKDLEKLEGLLESIRDSSKCGIGQTSPIPVLKALRYMREAFEKALKEGVRERGKYVFRLTAPCINACPAHLDIPSYVEAVREHEFSESLRIIRERLCLPGTLGRVCVRPCESNCRRTLVEGPVSIRELKRFVADYEIWKNREPFFDQVQAPKGKRVAIIGAGPAGLSCAHFLALLGYEVVIFEKHDRPGGMARWGIPDYRLPPPILEREAALIERLGVRIEYNTDVDQKKFQELLQQYDAIFIGVGAQGSTQMGVEGEKENYEGFIPGVRYLYKINRGEDPYSEGKSVIVVGGGNVAMDCVRTSLRLGKWPVRLVYRRTRAEMPANEEEIVEAEEEGVEFHFLCNPTRIIAEQRKVKAVELIRMRLGEPDASGRRRPEPVPGSEFVMETDILVPAIGQRVELPFLEGSKVKISKGGTVEVDPLTFQTSDPKVFSGGDCVTGPDVLIRAAAAGRTAALMIHAFLQKGKAEPTDEQLMDKILEKFKLFDPKEKVQVPPGQKREEPFVLEPEVRRHTFEEVNKGLKTPQAIREALRCLRCYRGAMVAL